MVLSKASQIAKHLEKRVIPKWAAYAHVMFNRFAEHYQVSIQPITARSGRLAKSVVRISTSCDKISSTSPKKRFGWLPTSGRCTPKIPSFLRTRIKQLKFLWFLSRARGAIIERRGFFGVVRSHPKKVFKGHFRLI